MYTFRPRRNAALGDHCPPYFTEKTALSSLANRLGIEAPLAASLNAVSFGTAGTYMGHLTASRNP